MATLMVFSLVFALPVLCGAQNRLNPRFSPIRFPWQRRESECYNGLFVPEEKLREMVQDEDLFFDELYEINDYQTLFTTTERCGGYENATFPRRGVRMKECDHSNIEPRLRKRSAPLGCCETKKRIIIPDQVVSYSRVFNVVHYHDSFQIVQLGECEDPGKSCTNSGTCAAAHRLQWLLVEGSVHDIFVPVSLSSYCKCIFS